MFASFQNIIKNGIYVIYGYTVWAYDIISGHQSKRAKARLAICKNCEFYNKGVCELCGCILKAKTRVNFDLDEEGKSIDGCPLKKW